MIENLRKYSGLMIVIFVILFISFFFLDSRSVRNMSSGHPMMKIAGRTYDDKDFNNLGKSPFQLAYNLAGRGDFGLVQFVMGLSVEDTSPEKFFIGRMILHQAKEEFGVFPGDDEISAYLRSLRAFAGPDGKFSQETYSNYIERGMGQLGLTEKDLRDLASDILAFKKINSIIGSGLTVDRDAVAQNFALENQQITGELAMLQLNPFEEKIKPTEEDIKKYWESIRDSFKTEPRRKFTYVIVTPDLPAEAKVDDAAETIADAAASDEVKKAAAKKKEEEKAKKAADLESKRRTAQLETDSKVATFLDKLVDQKGSGFEELVKANNWELKTSELFSRSSAPKDLDVNLRSSSRGGKAVDELFRIQQTSDPFSKISEAIPIGENQWLVARLDREEASRIKKYEEARNDARAQYISEKATEDMKGAATDYINKIKVHLSSGKTFSEAAKEVGISTTKPFSNVTRTYRPDGATEPQNLFQSARYLDPGTIAEPIIESDRIFILFVAKREIIKAADTASRLDTEVSNSSTQNESIAFTAWMNSRIDAAKVEELYKKK